MSCDMLPVGMYEQIIGFQQAPNQEWWHLNPQQRFPTSLSPTYPMSPPMSLKNGLACDFATNFTKLNILECGIGIVWTCVPGPWSLRFGSRINYFAFPLRLGVCFCMDNVYVRVIYICLSSSDRHLLPWPSRKHPPLSPLRGWLWTSPAEFSFSRESCSTTLSPPPKCLNRGLPLTKNPVALD